MRFIYLHNYQFSLYCRLYQPEIPFLKKGPPWLRRRIHPKTHSKNLPSKSTRHKPHAKQKLANSLLKKRKPKRPQAKPPVATAAFGAAVARPCASTSVVAAAGKQNSSKKRPVSSGAFFYSRSASTLRFASPRSKSRPTIFSQSIKTFITLPKRFCGPSIVHRTSVPPSTASNS